MKEKLDNHEYRITELESFVIEVRQVIKLARLILMAMGTSLGIDLVGLI